jgi:hypothetical protein
MDEKQRVIVKWLENEIKGKKWTDYILSYGYKNISIYGAGDLGKYLIWELRNSDININSVIDRRAGDIGIFEGYQVFTLEAFLQTEKETDAIIVTAVTAYDEVLRSVAEKRIELPVMSLRDMVFEL